MPFNPISPIPRKPFSYWGIQLTPPPLLLVSLLLLHLAPLTDGSTVHTFKAGIPWSLTASAEVDWSDGRWTKRIWRDWPRPDSSCTSVPFRLPRCEVLGSIDPSRFVVKVTLRISDPCGDRDDVNLCTTWYSCVGLQCAVCGSTTTS